MFFFFFFSSRRRHTRFDCGWSSDVCSSDYEASADEILGFFKRWPGTYQEDRLRNDWLLLLGQRRDWGMFDQVHGAFRMRDDRSVSCYALLIDSIRSEEHTSELQSQSNLVCRLLLEKKKKTQKRTSSAK